jgi:hypothetical protein
MRITEHRLRTHEAEMIHKEEAALIHPIMQQDGAAGLGGDDDGDTHQVWRETRPGHGLDGRNTAA